MSPMNIHPDNLTSASALTRLMVDELCDAYGAGIGALTLATLV